jgi:hypothetical protein
VTCGGVVSLGLTDISRLFNLSAGDHTNAQTQRKRPDNSLSQSPNRSNDLSEDGERLQRELADFQSRIDQELDEGQIAREDSGLWQKVEPD